MRVIAHADGGFDLIAFCIDYRHGVGVAETAVGHKGIISGNGDSFRIGAHGDGFFNGQVFHADNRNAVGVQVGNVNFSGRGQRYIVRCGIVARRDGTLAFPGVQAHHFDGVGVVNHDKGNAVNDQHVVDDIAQSAAVHIFKDIVLHAVRLRAVKREGAVGLGKLALVKDERALQFNLGGVLARVRIATGHEQGKG